MRMYPPTVPEGTLHGERRVHEALAAWDRVDGSALHSLFLPEHAYKITSEIDFLLVLDELVLVVEVKAAGVSCSGGLWTYSDRAGHRRTSAEGPFKQADSAMYALKGRLAAAGVRGLEDVAFGWMVVTPDVDLASSVEWAEDTHVGRGRFGRPGGLAQGVERAARYWLDKQPHCRPLGAERRRMLVQALRPDFEMVPPLGARNRDLDEAFVRLTSEQLDRLDMLADNERVLCTGGAGTGKTFVAAETARRLAGEGRRTVLVCLSPILAAYLRSAVGVTGVEVMTEAQLEKYDGDPFDAAVVDEGQDVMTVDFLDLLDRRIQGGLANGRWSFFYDPNTQARVHDRFETSAEEVLRAQGAVRVSLSRNCRNTREITFQTRAHTGADVGVATAGSGPEVLFPPVADVTAERASLDAHLRALLEADVDPGCISILSVSGDWEGSTARGTKAFRKGRVRRVDEAVAAAWPPQEITWCSVTDFKGLENAFICVVDMADVPDEATVELLYVAMTRARAGLWVAVRPEAGTRLSGLFKLNSRAAAAALREVPA